MIVEQVYNGKILNMYPHHKNNSNYIILNLEYLDYNYNLNSKKVELSIGTKKKDVIYSNKNLYYTIILNRGGMIYSGFKHGLRCIIDYNPKSELISLLITDIITGDSNIFTSKFNYNYLRRFSIDAKNIWK